MLIEYAILEYLSKNKTCSIPQLGNLRLTQHSAKFDVTTQKFIPPYNEVNINEAYQEDFNFIGSLSENMGVDYDSAKHKLTQFSNHLLNEINTKGNTDFLGLGYLFKTNDGSIVFNKDENFLQQTSVNAQQVIRPEDNHDILVGDKTVTKHEMEKAYGHTNAAEQTQETETVNGYVHEYTHNNETSVHETEVVNNEIANTQTLVDNQPTDGNLYKEKKDRWLVWAIGFTAAAVALIVTHFALNDWKLNGKNGALPLILKNTPKTHTEVKP